MNLLEECDVSHDAAVAFVCSVVSSMSATNIIVAEKGSDPRSAIKHAFDLKHAENITFVDMKSTLLVFVHDSRNLERDINAAIKSSPKLSEDWRRIVETVA
jgi:hypothetical protein